MTDEGSCAEGLKADIVAAIPSLCAFAVGLCGNPDRAEDLVQDTLQRALSSADCVSEGTNLTARLVTILRNVYYSSYREPRRQIPHPPSPGKVDPLFCEALSNLPADLREALTLVGAKSLSYEEAAKICGCAPGEIASRVGLAINFISGFLRRAEARQSKPKRLRRSRGSGR